MSTPTITPPRAEVLTPHITTLREPVILVWSWFGQRVHLFRAAAGCTEAVMAEVSNELCTNIYSNESKISRICFTGVETRQRQTNNKRQMCHRIILTSFPPLSEQ